MLKRNVIALHFDFVRVGKRPISDLQPFELQNFFTPNSHLMNFVRTSSPGHFQAPKNLSFKTRLQWCKTFLLKMNFTCMRINNHFDINRFSLCLTLEQRLKATRKWPIGYLSLSIDALQFATILASHAGVFRGARISSLPTNGVCGEGRKTSSPKNACVGGYYHT